MKSTLVEDDLVVVAGITKIGWCKKVLVAQHSVGPGQSEEAEHAAYSGLGVEYEAFVVDGQTTRAHAELLALLEHLLNSVRPPLQTLTEVVLSAALVDSYTTCEMLRKSGCL